MKKHVRQELMRQWVSGDESHAPQHVFLLVHEKPAQVDQRVNADQSESRVRDFTPIVIGTGGNQDWDEHGRRLFSDRMRRRVGDVKLELRRLSTVAVSNWAGNLSGKDGNPANPVWRNVAE